MLLSPIGLSVKTAIVAEIKKITDKISDVNELRNFMISPDSFVHFLVPDLYVVRSVEQLDRNCPRFLVRHQFDVREFRNIR